MTRAAPATAFWATRHESYGPGWAAHYWDDVTAPQRGHLLRAFERLQAAAPVESVLEVGCNAGPNLRVLARAYPRMALAGLDVNPVAIATARDGFAALGRSVRLEVGALPGALDAWPDQSVDVVYSVYCLAYLDTLGTPADVEWSALHDTIHGLQRIARRAVLLLEPMHTGGMGMSHLIARTAPAPASLEWSHDYAQVIGRPADWGWAIEPPVDRLNRLAVWERAR